MTENPYITFRCPPHLRAALEQLAKDDDRSISYIVKRAVEEHIDKCYDVSHASGKGLLIRSKK